MKIIYGGGKNVNEIVKDLRWIGKGNIMGVKVKVIMIEIVLMVQWWIIKRQRFGRYIYEVGGNNNDEKK